MTVVSVAIEGQSDEGAARKLLSTSGLEIGGLYGRRGKGDLLRRLSGFNQAAKFTPWFVAVDLDRDFECPGEAAVSWISSPADQMFFRVVVRELEAWLLADVETAARFLGVRQSLLPSAPEDLDDPKGALIQLARRSNKRSIREGLVPRPGSGSSIGPTYASDVSAFGETTWRPEIAAERAPGLARCLVRLQEFAARLEC